MEGNVCLGNVFAVALCPSWERATLSYIYICSLKLRAVKTRKKESAMKWWYDLRVVPGKKYLSKSFSPVQEVLSSS